ncbi:glycosyltransferase family 39 protein [Chloroflexota bacterium]
MGHNNDRHHQVQRQLPKMSIAERLGFVPDWEKTVVALILLLFVSLAALYSVATPLFEGYDEPWHYAYVQHIASGRGLPRQPPDQHGHLARQEASQPPLYYMLAAAATWWIPADDLPSLLWRNPQFAPIPWSYHDNQNIIVHTGAEGFPYRGAALGVHLSRLLSVLLGAGTVYCTYALSRLIFPGQTAVALGAMIVTAFTPGFIFTSALVNNDTLVILLASVALVLVARVWTGRISWPAVILLGLVLGCAALTKLSGLLLWLFTCLTLIVAAWRQRDFALLVRVGLPVFLLAGLVSAWWYARNWALYGDVTGLNMFLEIMGRREPGFGLVDVLAESEGIRRSYWALFGWFNVSVPEWLYRTFDLVSLAALIGLVLYTVRQLRRRRWSELWSLSFLLVWVLFNIVALVRWTLTTPGSQGRLVYPAISAISILLMRGWLALVPRRRAAQRWVVTAIAVALFSLALYVPFFSIVPAYARPPLLLQEDAESYVSTELDTRFEEGVTLLGYEVDRPEVEPGELLWVTLCWEGRTEVDEDLTLFVQLLVENDLIAAQKDTYHGLGTYPTSLWPVDARFCERYPLRVADTVPASGPSSVLAGLYRSTGERLQAFNSDGQPTGDSIRLPGPQVNHPPTGRVLDYGWGHQISLVDYRLDRTRASPGEALSISLQWRADRRMPTDYVATVQVLDQDGTKIGQSDLPLSTSTWQPGTEVEDHRTLEISPDAAAGVYDIKVGMYEPDTVENLTLYKGRLVVPGGGLLRLWGVRIVPH